MSRLLTVLFVLLTVGCSQLQTKPAPPPPPTSQAQEVTRAQSLTLRKLGTISVNEHGSPDDAERAIAAKANSAGATYYYIQLVSETVMPGFWYSTAILYGPSTTASPQ
ncbi:biofilm peroxide resistance protein BsmA [Erwinia sp.]|uniref:biofilm peroxide resistance protein BsmA n=1 Tax=Erwinia citreus TaxID=558 RepID=UPI003C76620A